MQHHHRSELCRSSGLLCMKVYQPSYTLLQIGICDFWPPDSAKSAMQDLKITSLLHSVFDGMRGFGCCCYWGPLESSPDLLRGRKTTNDELGSPTAASRRCSSLLWPLVAVKKHRALSTAADAARYSNDNACSERPWPSMAQDRHVALSTTSDELVSCRERAKAPAARHKNSTSTSLILPLRTIILQCCPWHAIVRWINTSTRAQLSITMFCPRNPPIDVCSLAYHLEGRGTVNVNAKLMAYTGTSTALHTPARQCKAALWDRTFTLYLLSQYLDAPQCIERNRDSAKLNVATASVHQD